MVKIEIPLIFTPLLLKTSDPEGILERKRYEISLKIAEAILYSIKRKKKKIMSYINLIITHRLIKQFQLLLVNFKS